MSTKVVWKFPLAVLNNQTVKMPAKAQILTAQTQGEALNLWALVDPMNEVEDRTILVVDTGHNIPDFVTKHGMAYISTFQLQGGALIFHVFELG